MSEASPECAGINRSDGIFRQKTKAMHGGSKLSERHGGNVPAMMEELVTLPGVGRKTANVILGHVYDKPGFVVDTHVRRLCYRLGLTRSRDPEEIEHEVGALLAPRDWTPFSMRLILHGRNICYARSPKCEVCDLSDDCPKMGVTEGRGAKAKRRQHV